jgi:NADH-quinone oxidoreductase subunit A
MQPGPLWPLVLYFVAVLMVVGAMIAISYFLGQRHTERATGEPFESGVVGVGFARLRFPAHFYLVAVFFVIFDLEAVFIFAWAIALHESGWAGYIEILVFIAILVAALIYLWRIGALDWGPEQRARRPGLPASLGGQNVASGGPLSQQSTS